MNETSIMEDADRRKRLGQFFTGERLARLLAALAHAREARTVIDPMAGSGDMLVACSAVGCMPESLVGIEIDPVAATVCRSRLLDAVPSFGLVEGNAFDPASWDGLPHAWDLVITNPPYVRYQLGSSVTKRTVSIPSAREIRKALLACLSTADNLEDNERAGFTTCAKQYSGLADLAVPSWILCCARVAIGGRLAVVVPNTWLSRDYAVPVLYMLRRFFDIEYVVEDVDMAWFADALARTTLVVAKRVDDKKSPYRPGGHMRLSLPRKLSNEMSLVGALFPSHCDSEFEFAKWAGKRLNTKDTGDNCGVHYSWSDEHDLRYTLRHAADRHDWLPKDSVATEVSSAVPEQIRQLLEREPRRLASLQELGWTVGQGLRTGANDFFYVSVYPTGAGYSSPLLPGEKLNLPTEVLRPAIRRQSELPADGQRVVEYTQSYVLVLEGWALSEDSHTAGGSWQWHLIEGDLDRLVRAGATKTYQRGEKLMTLPELSAVRTNVRRSTGDPPVPPRFWYHLPPLAPRHTPDIYLARINGDWTIPYLNSARSVVIDANFSTLWSTRADAITAPVLLALLSSSWTVAFLEAMGTVLGGGALKVEATHLRRLLLPIPHGAAVGRLAELASGWIERSSQADPRSGVDNIVFKLIGCSSVGSSISKFADERLRRRIG